MDEIHELKCGFCYPDAMGINQMSAATPKPISNPKKVRFYNNNYTTLNFSLPS